MTYKNEIQILEEQANPQKAHQNQLIQESFKENIFLADGILEVKGNTFATFVNTKGQSFFTSSQITFIKSVGGFYDTAFKAWIIKLEKPRSMLSKKLENKIIPCGVCGEEIVWIRRETGGDFVAAKYVDHPHAPRHICKRDKVVYIH